MRFMSHPTMGAWIEISLTIIALKNPLLSHPTMGAWIEIILKNIAYVAGEGSHPTMGAWIEILDTLSQNGVMHSRTPRWVRGLKSVCMHTCYTCRTSHPTMAAWIEIYNCSYDAVLVNVAPHDGCVD